MNTRRGRLLWAWLDIGAPAASRVAFIAVLVAMSALAPTASGSAPGRSHNYDSSAASTTPPAQQRAVALIGRPSPRTASRSLTSRIARFLTAKAETRIAGDVEGFIGPGGHRNIPSDWLTQSGPRPARGGRGQRYWDPNNPKGNYVRIEEDAINGRHVHVTSGGKQVLCNGDRHIPFDVWDSWATFSGP